MICELYISDSNYFCCFSDIEKEVWKLNTSTRLARLSSMAVESQPIVVSQSTEVSLDRKSVV